MPELSAEDLVPLPDLQADAAAVVDRRKTPEVVAAREEARELLRQQREKAEIAAENRSGLREEVATSQEVEVRGGETKDALDKIFLLEKKKLEVLLATGEYAAEDFATDLREELADAEFQLRMISSDDDTGPAERADLHRVIEIAKFKLSVIEEWQKNNS